MQLFKNLKFRLLATLFSVLFALFYAFGYIVIHTLETSYKQSLESTLFTLLKDIKHDFHEDTTKPIAFNETKNEFDVPLLYAQIVAYDSMSNVPHIIQSSNDLKGETLTIEPKIIQKIFEHPNDVVYSTMKNSKLTQKDIHIGTLFLAQNEFQMLFLQCAMPYEKNSPQIKEMIFTLWVGLLLLLGVILGMAYFLISKSLSNVLHVTHTVKTLSANDMHTTIPKTHVAYEIDDLIDTFNILLGELQHAYSQVKQFGQNASHELKTPLTIIKGEVEIGLRKERSSTEYQAILNKVAKEVNALHEVIEKILFLSSNTKNDLKKHFTEVYIDEILLESINEKSLLAEQKNIKLLIATLEAQSFQGNATLLKIALSNLIDNAIKYSPKDSTIHITLHLHELEIKDEGIGIKEEDIAHVFDQFYRADRSKQAIQGSGLGLAIVKSICDLHDMTISIQSKEDRGTTIVMTF